MDKSRERIAISDRSFLFGLSSLVGLASLLGLLLEIPPATLATALAEEMSFANCHVGLRVIKGSQNSKEFSFRSLAVGKQLADIKSQLEPLPYGQYEVLDSETQLVRFGEEAQFSIRDANSLIHFLEVTPLGWSRKRIEVRVEWKGPRGKQLLSSKLRVADGKNVMLGTDSSSDESTIMSVKVSCDEAPA